MEKKIYVKPSFQVYKMDMRKIICTSDEPFNTGYAPGIPGSINADEKKLA